jgi:myo-inositol-1-phosphate synthase
VNDSSERRLGLWLVGARGAVSTCVAYGLFGLQKGLLEPLGLVTARRELERLPLCDLERVVVAGHEVVRTGLGDAASELVRQRVLPPELVAGCAAEAAAFDARIRAGVLDGPDVGTVGVSAESERLGAASPREQIERLAADVEAFRGEHELERVVVVNLASTEAWRADQPEWEDLAALDAALDAGRHQPASIVYAYAALAAGCAYVNFTPSRGASIPALRELARERRLPHCGNDAKTGETLLKTALAPMFVARNLRVLSWQGYNMLGNRDGEVLADPGHRQAKLRNKDEALRAILGDERVHSHVGIDYVPSLGDWKTAWDFVHFEGFLGARMSLQLTWQGCDSALAAPLVLDLFRLSELAARRGEAGVMRHVASFFKSPIEVDSHDFHEQYRCLLEYAQR